MQMTIAYEILETALAIAFLVLPQIARKFVKIGYRFIGKSPENYLRKYISCKVDIWEKKSPDTNISEKNNFCTKHLPD